MTYTFKWAFGPKVGPTCPGLNPTTPLTLRVVYYKGPGEPQHNRGTCGWIDSFLEQKKYLLFLKNVDTPKIFPSATNVATKLFLREAPA